jgi:hypothetical protein
MIGSLRNLWDGFRGSGAMALTVPPMDGAFRPNTAIETAEVVTKGDQPDNVAVAGASAFFSDGAQVIGLTGDRKPEAIVTMPDVVTAIASAPDGTLAIASASGRISFIGPRQLALRSPKIEAGQGDITAMAFLDAERLAITVGSQVNAGSVRYGSGTWSQARRRRSRMDLAIQRAWSIADRRNWWSPKPG